eukprot:TRINITY_DN7862_c0_g1_i1.p1 TRINITY_DN7862_c0_g1~~TRINITY_DN7862_c0_g1_i1.p1  ORF type:complete len:121 (-),score=23.93 TRINITY_DN7862_c0_g1_i1:245-607(-)
MAANLQRRGFTIFGKRFLDRKKWISSSSSSSYSGCRMRAAHFSAYDKNVDEEMHPNSAPEDVIRQHINNYWAPHPQTGVFGPIDQHQHQPSPPAAAADGSVLEHQAWFRPLEDVDKPTPP